MLIETCRREILGSTGLVCYSKVESPTAIELGSFLLFTIFECLTTVFLPYSLMEDLIDLDKAKVKYIDEP
jgi:hypothetical protein